MITVKEIHALAPGAEVYRLDPEARYLIAVKRTAFGYDGMQNLGKGLEQIGIHAVLIVVHQDVETPIQLFEMEPSK